MEAIKEPDWSISGILGAARGAAQATTEGAIGTEHLLAGITTANGAAREALADAGATRTALMAVLRDRKGQDSAWRGADDVRESVAAQDVLGEDGDRRVRFTGAAARALRAAMALAQREDAARFGAVQLLRGLLEEDNRAVEMLGVCGISPRAVRARLEGGADATADRDDALAPLLHTTRDVLLGRSIYRHLPFWERWLVRSAGSNLASRPAWWVGMETHEQAHRLGDGTMGTEHVLLAILATHEVALQYPHLAGENAPAPNTRYKGGERLAGLGIDYASVHSALTADRILLTADARPAEQYIDEATDPGTASPPASDREPVPDPGTGPLVETLLTEKTRARQLIDALTTTS